MASLAFHSWSPPPQQPPTVTKLHSREPHLQLRLQLHNQIQQLSHLLLSCTQKSRHKFSRMQSFPVSYSGCSSLPSRKPDRQSLSCSAVLGKAALTRNQQQCPACSSNAPTLLEYIQSDEFCFLLSNRS